MNNLKAKINEKGKVQITGTVDEERDWEPIKDNLPNLRKQREDLEDQIKQNQDTLDAMEKNEPVVFDGELEKFIELSRKVQLINKKNTLVSNIEKFKQQLDQLDRGIKENEQLEKEYAEYVEKKFKK